MGHLIERLQSYSKAVAQALGLRAHRRAMPDGMRRPGGARRSERRSESRHVRLSPCTFGLMHGTDRGSATIEEGEGTAVNDSPTGMRLLLGIAPQKGQLLEIQTGNATAKRSVYLAEVRWTKPLRAETQGSLFLVGCRLQFGPTHYWAL